MRFSVVCVFALALFGCGGSSEDELLGDRSFMITEECEGGDCQPVCEDTYCDVCDHSEPPSEGGCWITGIGFVIDVDGEHDNFGGNGMPMKEGYLRGEWEHVDHATNNKFHGQIAYLVCRKTEGPGPDVPKAIPNQSYYGGPGRWYEPSVGWQEGYWFDVVAEDHGEPGNIDEYYFTVRHMSDPKTVLYRVGGVIDGGNFQIHPPNSGHPFTKGTLPTWVTLVP